MLVERKNQVMFNGTYFMDFRHGTDTSYSGHGYWDHVGLYLPTRKCLEDLRLFGACVVLLVALINAYRKEN